MFLALVALLLPLGAFAEDSVPTLKCPAVPDAYSKMLTNVKALQAQIKRDANGTCNPVLDEVISLEKLLGDRRKAVESLIERSKKDPLMDEEYRVVRDYVNDVTTKVINTADLMDRSGNCFDDDKKTLGFADLASITLDATALAKTVAGPWAVPISLGGQALAGIFQGLDKVMKNKRGFDFDKIDQRESFVQSLCSYYNYRQDMANLMFPARRAAQLRRLETALESNLSEMTKGCPECQELSSKAQSGEASPTELNQLAHQANADYVRPLGTYTVQSVSAMAWARAESQRLREETGDEFGIGRDLLSEKAADMDRFFFEKESPRFLKAQNQKAYGILKQFSKYVMVEGHGIAYAASEKVKVDLERLYTLSENEVLEFVTGLRADLGRKNETKLLYRIDDYERQSLELLDRAMLALQVQESYCRFFEKAGYYNASLQYQCESGTSATVRADLDRLEQAKNALQPVTPGASDLPTVARRSPPKGLELNSLIPLSAEEVSTDWTESLYRLVGKINRDPFLFRKK